MTLGNFTIFPFFASLAVKWGSVLFFSGLHYSRFFASSSTIVVKNIMKKEDCPE